MKGMKCNQKNCEGEFRVLSSYYSYGVKKRHRKCNVCGHDDYTIEISSKEYDRMRKLIFGMKDLISQYLGK